MAIPWLGYPLRCLSEYDPIVQRVKRGNGLQQQRRRLLASPALASAERCSPNTEGGPESFGLVRGPSVPLPGETSLFLETSLCQKQKHLHIAVVVPSSL